VSFIHFILCNKVNVLNIPGLALDLFNNVLTTVSFLAYSRNGIFMSESHTGLRVLTSCSVTCVSDVSDEFDASNCWVAEKHRLHSFSL
jgi:hypothetical protein